MSKKESLRTWIEIDTKAIAHNYKVFRKLLDKKTKLLAVIKSNAYGHNIHEFAPVMERLGADWLGVDSLVEARSVREAKVKLPVLVLGYTLPTHFHEAREKEISVTVSSFTQLEAVRKELMRKGKKLKVHIKVDTGMHRQGFQWDERKELLEKLKDPVIAKSMVLEGFYTHLAEAKNPRSGDNTRRQIAQFEEWVKFFRDAGYTPLIHAAATGGTLLYPESRLDMVRIGIGSYGLWPSDEAEHHMKSKIELQPVLSWYSIVSEVKRVKMGERVGYDFTEMLGRDTTIAIVPVGYWHGIPRALSSRGRVLIRKKTARIVGRVSMDMIVVDVTDIPNVTPGDTVTLIGKDGKEVITAGEIARFSGTTHYEIVTRLNPLIKKFYK